MSTTSIPHSNPTDEMNKVLLFLCEDGNVDDEWKNRGKKRCWLRDDDEEKKEPVLRFSWLSLESWMEKRKIHQNTRSRKVLHLQYSHKIMR